MCVCRGMLQRELKLYLFSFRSLHPSEKFFPDFVSLEVPGVRINLCIGQAEETGNIFVCS